MGVMPFAMNYSAPDLTQHPPRSVRVRLGGYVLLPRMIDKCRAELAGKNGPYHYNCPLDQRLLAFAGMDADAFKAEVAKGKGDGELLDVDPREPEARSAATGRSPNGAASAKRPHPPTMKAASSSARASPRPDSAIAKISRRGSTGWMRMISRATAGRRERLQVSFAILEAGGVITISSSTSL